MKKKYICEINCIHDESVTYVREKMLADDTILLLAETFKVLGEPVRVKIINALLHAELCVCDIAAALDMSQSAISHQLRMLRSLKLVKYRKEGKIVYYSLNDSHIEKLFYQGLEHLEE